MRVEKGLAEPRTSQGIFGPNGNKYGHYPTFMTILMISTDELVCFSHVPVRMLNLMETTSMLSPPESSRPRNQSNVDIQKPSGVLSDAINRLTTAARDRDNTLPAIKSVDEEFFRTLESLEQRNIEQVSCPDVLPDVLLISLIHIMSSFMLIQCTQYHPTPQSQSRWICHG
jgi:hypothetical protein